MSHKSVRYVLLALGILAALLYTAKFFLMPKNEIYWERHLWVAPVLLACASWAGVIYFFPKSDKLWPMWLVVSILAGFFLIYAVAYAMQFLQG